MSKFDELAEGSVGYFWPDSDGTLDLEQALAGYVHLSSDGQLVIDVVPPQNADPMLSNNTRGIPYSIIAATAVTEALFVDIQSMQHKSAMGDFRPNTSQYRCQAVVIGPSIHLLRSPKFTSVSAFFPGVARWAGISATAEQPGRGKDGKIDSWSVEIRSPKEVSMKLPGGKLLSLSTHWEVTGPADRRVLYSPVSLRVTSKRPSEWAVIMKPLVAVQGLLSLAFDGLVLANGGRAELDTAASNELGNKPTWWTSRLMQQPPGVRIPKSMDTVPSFYLADINGTAGIQRWVNLQDKYPRAVGPLVSQHRFAVMNVETRLLELAAAMEYWVAVHRRTRKWAAKSPEGLPLVYCLAKFVGKSFGDWVGDIEEWSRQFWDSYNLLKHNPNAVYDVRALHLLTRSGGVLLQCVLLNRAALSTRPTRAVCESHQHYELGRQVRAMLDTCP